LWLAASSGQAFAAACAAIMASDSGRRPKGVVGLIWDMALACRQATEKGSPNRRHA
jgi:hypothetical protein